MDLHNKELIINEISRLDKLLEYNVSSIEVKYIKSSRRIGCYYYNPVDKTEYFAFSENFYMSESFSEREKLYTVRHEYAHFINLLNFGNRGHGKTWKTCCGMTGAFPIRCCDSQRNEYFKTKEEKEKEIKSKLDQFYIGQYIEHSAFGKGKIISISGSYKSLSAEVKFDNIIKRISLYWLITQS